MYRILIALKRGRYEYENVLKWYSEKDENGFYHIIIFEDIEDARDKVKELLTNPQLDYSFHDLIIVKHENYAIEISEGEDIGDVTISI